MKMFYVDKSYILFGQRTVSYIEASIVTILVAAACKQAISLACFAQESKGSAEPALLLICHGSCESENPKRLECHNELGKSAVRNRAGDCYRYQNI